METECSPQCEDGFTRIANELLEALTDTRLSGRQWQIILLVIRNTYGFSRKEWKTSNQEISKLLKMHRQHTHYDIKELSSRKIIFVTENGYERSITIGIQKNYNKWCSLPKTVTVTENGYDSLPKTVTVPLKKKEKGMVPPLPKTVTDRKKKCQLPKDFVLSEKLIKFAVDKGIQNSDVQDLFETFCDHFWNNGQTGLDWDRAWYNWVRREIKWHPKKYTNECNAPYQKLLRRQDDCTS